MATVGTIAVQTGADGEGVSGHPLTVATGGTPDGEINTLLTDSQNAVLVPKSGGLQMVGVRIRLDGVELGDFRLSVLRVDRSLDVMIQQASFQWPVFNGATLIGDSLLHGAPQAGLDPWDIELAYRDTAGVEFVTPLMTGGIQDSGRKVASRTVTEETVITDRGRLFRDVPVSKSFPAGHNLTRDTVARKLLDLAGDTGSSFPPMGRMTKPVDVSSGQIYPLISDLFDVEGYKLVREPTGEMSARLDAIEAPRPTVQWIYDEDSILLAANGQPTQIEILPAPEAYTKVSAKGTEQVIRSGGCGLLTFFTESESEVGDNEPPADWLQQSPGGGVISAPAVPVIPPLIGQREKIETTLKCGTVVAERIRTWTLANPTKARYTRNTISGLPVLFFACRLVENSPTSIGLEYDRRRLIQTQEITRNWEFTFTNGAERLWREHEETETLYTPKAAVGTDGGSDFDYLDRGDGSGLADQDAERLRLTNRKTVVYAADENNFVRSKVTTVEGYGLLPGVNFIYADGRTSSEDEERFRVLSKLTERWAPAGGVEGLFTYTATSEALGNVPLTSGHTFRGQPPVIPIINTGEPIRSDFDTDEEFDEAEVAEKFELQEIQATCDAPDLLAIRPQRELLDAVFPWAENVTELGAICDRLILLGQAPRVRFTVPVNGRLREGDLVRVRARIPGIGLDHDVHVRSVGTVVLGGGALVSEISGVVYG